MGGGGGEGGSGGLMGMVLGSSLFVLRCVLQPLPFVSVSWRLPARARVSACARCVRMRMYEQVVSDVVVAVVAVVVAVVEGKLCQMYLFTLTRILPLYMRVSRTPACLRVSMNSCVRPRVSAGARPQ